jgi:putative selenium metabolism protein SsnA
MKSEHRPTHMLVTNARLATLGAAPRLISDGALLVEDGHIAAVGNTRELTGRFPDAQHWDLAGQLVLPASICAHTHFYGAFARGMAVPGEPASNFVEILERLWWRLDESLTAEDIRYSTLVCLADAIRHGTTTLIDHHASPGFIDGSLDVIADAVQEAGVRACLCYEVTDRGGAERARRGIAENVRFAKWLESSPRPLLAASFGLHASLTLSDRTLLACVDAADGLDIGFHTHLAEDEADQADSLSKYGKRVVRRLDEAGILGKRAVAAHCVHVDEDEIGVLADRGVWVTHQPRSNMNNGVGVAPVQSMLDAGIKVCLGNDGFSNQMFAEMKAAYLVHKLWQKDPRSMPGDVVMRLAYANNARLAKVFWSDELLGGLSEGASADLVVLDYHPTTPLSEGNLPWHILFGLEASAITGTMCAGRILMRDRELLTLDEEAITARSRELASQAWGRL